MCGICGLKGLTQEKRNIYVRDMMRVLYHRGPDEHGEYLDNSISLGIRRLNIIDLKTGSQPIYNEDQSIVVVCNGEIYNFITLRKGLIKKGHDFRTVSDVEVLVHLYEEHGIDLLSHIKGMFSFAIWDKDKQVLFIARDRFGIKPLYYYNKNGIFAFSSELKALLKLPFVNKDLDTKALNLYFSLEYVPSPYSIWRDIYKLRPAHYILYGNGELKIRRYWDLRNSVFNNGLPRASAKDELKRLLLSSVKEHLISDVPLGIFLSGGIDSSTLVALERECSNQRLSTFSIGFEEKSFNESDHAFMVSRCLGTDHHNYVFTIDDFINNFYNLTNFLDEPFADLSIFPTYMLSKFSRKYVKVALSGEGADELFMGYPTYLAHHYMNLFNRYFKGFRRFSRYLINSLPTSFEYFSVDFKLKQFVKGMDQGNPVARHMMWMSAFCNGEKNALFTEKFKQDTFRDGIEINDFISMVMSNVDTEERYKKIQYLDIFTYLAEDILVKSDRASMFSSLEVRVPYLDHEVVEFIWGLDYNMVYQKKLMKEIVKDMLPGEVLSRPKKGFPVPFSYWIRNKRFFNLIEEFFSKDFINKQGIFSYSYINCLLREHKSNKKDNRKKLRTYIMFQSWYKTWFK